MLLMRCRHIVHATACIATRPLVQQCIAAVPQCMRWMHSKGALLDTVVQRAATASSAQLVDWLGQCRIPGPWLGGVA